MWTHFILTIVLLNPSFVVFNFFCFLSSSISIIYIIVYNISRILLSHHSDLLFSNSISNYHHYNFVTKDNMEIKNMVTMVARSGRQLQRYNKGHRQVVGCIPYRIKGNKEQNLEDALEVLVISAQRKGKGMLFPKGGWESDESINEAALRETMEEAGVFGTLECLLGTWHFKSKTNGSLREGYMFPLLVKGQLDFWPEKDIRQRVWVSVPMAKEVCQQPWMKEALDLLVKRLESTTTMNDEEPI
ncbi:putative hydrolase [Helianthus anomalus]